MKTFLEFKIPLSIFREGKYFIAYTPVLDLSTAGKSYEEAKKRFNEIVTIFFKEIAQKGTLEEVLQELGWEKIHKRWSPPVIVAHEPEKIRILFPA